MEQKNIGDYLKGQIKYLVVGAGVATGLLISSPHYYESPKPNEFRRPEVKAVDFSPLYGMYTYSNRMREANPFTEGRKISLEDIATIGTSSWKDIPGYQKTKNATAIQNVCMAFYHIALSGMVVLEYFGYRRRKKYSAQGQG